MTDSKALAPMESFMERVKGKLRDDIGNMLPDEVVAGLVQKVIQDEFFTRKRIPAPGRGSYSTDTVEVPSEFQKMVIEASKPIIEKHVLALMAERAEELDQQIQESVRAGLMKFAVSAMDQVFAHALGGQSWQIEQIIKSAMESKRI